LGGMKVPNVNWSDLSPLQLGRYAEYFAKMEFTSFGMEVFTSEVDDRGIDFIIKDKNGRFSEIQVKSVRNSNYTFVRKDKFNIENENLYLCLLMFNNGVLPEVYLIPARIWKNPNPMFVDKDYEGLKSNPEYGVNFSRKNYNLLYLYRFEETFRKEFL
jgi:hypothetical protein